MSQPYSVESTLLADCGNRLPTGAVPQMLGRWTKLMQIFFVKRVLLIAACLLALSLHCVLPTAAQLKEDAAVDEARVIDTHVHLWDLERPDGIYWISKDNTVLYRSMLPQTHEPIAQANGVQGVVVVQAGQYLPDNQWVLDVTAHNTELYLGVVGNLSEVIGTDRFAPLLEQLCEDDRYLGYRLSGRYQDELSDAFFRDLKLTAEMGKSVDILLGNYSLEDVVTIAKRVPELKIIVDHFGGVQLNQMPLDAEWVQEFRTVAACPNVFCKVSALYGRFKDQPAPRDASAYQEIMDLALACFGEDRLVFGSDWPVTRTTGDYSSVLKLTRDWADLQQGDLTDKLFHQNASKFYGVTLPSR